MSNIPEGFKRENRYIVIKRSDLKKVPVAYRSSLVDPMFALLSHLPHRECMVIESDWPEYEPTWAAIERRMTAGLAPANALPVALPTRMEHGFHPMAHEGFRGGWNSCLDAMSKLGPLYTQPDAGDVERLRKDLDNMREEREDLSKKLDRFYSRNHGIKALSDIEALRDQLAERDALLRKVVSSGNLVAENEPTGETVALHDSIEAALSASAEPSAPVSFQQRVQPWMLACFGEMIAGDREERNHRFLEEALELVQSLGATADEAHQLVDYVYGRPVGEPGQEVGGVMVTLAALCQANSLDMHQQAETELARIWTKVEQIRAKQASKPQFGPLPGVYPDRVSMPPSGPGASIVSAWNDRQDRHP
ncbi:hypothetical protein [Pseudomonas gingeri]|uniref:hypothetical protein n=1 Tax=Pseudomonas gingeri TaxID=117681 RepID=UPI001C43088C|nr:hypothetical protein [Pseudomonas gingeri]